jgi:hypothetical protein
MSDFDTDRAVIDLGARLRDRLEPLDELELARLRAARSSAVDAMSVPVVASQSAIPFGVAAALLVTVVVGLVSLEPRSSEVVVVSPVPIPEPEVLLGPEDLEFLGDLEFYAWLEMQAEADAEAEDDTVTDG